MPLFYPPILVVRCTLVVRCDMGCSFGVQEVFVTPKGTGDQGRLTLRPTQKSLEVLDGVCSFCVKKVFRTQKSSKVNSPLGQSFGPSTSLAPPFTVRLNDGNGPMIVHNVTESGQVCNSTEVPEGPKGRRQPRRMAGKSQQPPASAGGLVFFEKFRRRDQIHK